MALSLKHPTWVSQNLSPLLGRCLARAVVTAGSLVEWLLCYRSVKQLVVAMAAKVVIAEVVREATESVAMVEALQLQPVATRFVVLFVNH